MDPYKTPQADLTVNEKNDPNPVMALLYGLGIAIIVTGVVSIIVSVVFGVAMDVDFNDLDAFESALMGSPLFMMTDIAFSAAVLYLAGIVVGRQVPGMEVRYGIIVSLITLAVYLFLSITTEAFSIYPLWYNALSLLIVLPAMIFGAKSAVKSQ